MSALGYALGGLGRGYAAGKNLIEQDEQPLGATPRPPADPPTPGGLGTPPPPPGNATAYGANPELMDLIDATEARGDYGALYGYSNREGGRFEGVDVTKMTLDQLAEFSSPNGEYGQWVAERNDGVVSTPMGRGQVVGRTLREAATELGLPGDTLYTPDVQHKIIDHLAQRRMRGKDESAAIAGLRAEWKGLRNVPDHVLVPVVRRYMQSGQTPRSRPLGAM